jgi:hypothetical protein
MGERQRRLTLPTERGVDIARQPLKASQSSSLTCPCDKGRLPAFSNSASPMMMNNSTHEFERLLGKAALALWSDFPRKVQETLFETAVARDAIIRNHLASFLHDHHPKTAHPAKPAQSA